MHFRPDSNRFASLQIILAELLQKSLEVGDFDLCGLSAERLKISQLKIDQTMPLNRIESGTQLTYASAIALKLNASSNHALSLAQQIAKNLHLTIQSAQIQISAHFGQDFGQDFGRDLQILIATPGWIYLQIGSASLEDWLQYQAQSSVLILNYPAVLNYTSCQHKFDQESDHFFSIAHSHARCHSILRAADAGEWRLTASAPIEIGSQAAAWQPAEWQLIKQLVDTVDALALASLESCPKPLSLAQIGQLAYQLSQRFQAFYAVWPSVWPSGRMAAQDQQAVRQRLELVLLTQRLLHLLLRWLNLPAPEHL